MNIICLPAIKNPEISVKDLNHDLDVIRQWKLVFNHDPTKQVTEVLFSCKKFSPNHPHIMYNGTIVAKMNGQKQLGIILDSFKNHLNEKIIKAKKYLGIIKYLSIFLPHKTLDLMYKALVCSHLDYSEIIYHIPPSMAYYKVGHASRQT